MSAEVYSLDWLLEWDWNSETLRFSRYGAVTYGGNEYVPRILKIADLGGIFIDRTHADFDTPSFTLDNLADDWSSNFFVTGLDAVKSFEDTEVRLYLYDRATGTATEMWTGLIKRPDFSPDGGSCTLTATFPVDAIEIQVPCWTLGRTCPHAFNGSPTETLGGTVPSAGCTWTPARGLNPDFPEASATSCDKSLDGPNGCMAHNNEAEFGGLTHVAERLNKEPNNTLEREDIRESIAPIVIGDGPLKVRPVIYRAVVRDNFVDVNGIISTVHPDKPFEEDQFAKDRFKLWGEIRASYVEIYYGDVGQPVPGNRTYFPEAAGHSLWCYFFARFPITPEQKDRAENTELKGDVVVKIDGGRPILDGGVRTENPVRAMLDVIEDRANGVGWPAARIDDAAADAAASYVGTRFRGRFEYNKPKAFMDWLQESCGSWHGYVAYEGGKLAPGAKRHDEAAVVTFGTGGLSIADGGVRWFEKDYSELTTGVLFKYRDKLRNGHTIPRRDPGAQRAAGNGIEKREWEKVWIDGIYDQTEAEISSAIWMREEINLNGFVEFKTPLTDFRTARAAGLRMGKVFRLNSPKIPDNATNYLFRLFDWKVSSDTYEVKLLGQLYDGAVYAYNSEPLGDIIRDGAGPSTGGRPPDVEDVAAVIVDVFVDEGDPANTDDDTRMARIECSAAYPDLTDQMEEDHEEGYTTEYPVIGYRLLWRFTDEPAQTFAIGPFVAHPETVGHLEVPFHKKRSVQILFAAVGRNNSYAHAGYVLDPEQTTYLDEDVDDAEPAIDVADGAVFDDDDLVRCEGEFMRVASVAGDTVTMEASGGDRTPQLGSLALEHPAGTEIGVAVLSHPSVTVDMSARRYTLPVPEDVRLRRRPKHLRARCDDVDHDAGEKYLWYVTYTAALDDGSDFMDAWGTEDLDPLNPSAFDPTIALFKSQQHFVLIDYEDLDALYGADASGVAPKIRCAAKLKRNFSSSPSAFANQAGHGNAPSGPPSTPTAAEIAFEDVPGSNKVMCKFLVGSSENTRPLDEAGDPTFDARNMDIVGVRLQKYDKVAAAWSTTEFRTPSVEIEDPETQKTQQVEIELHRGSKWRWVRSFAKNRGTRRKKSPDANIVFIVGSKTDDITTITDLAIAAFGATEATNSIEEDPRHSQLLVTFTQPADPVALHLLQIQKKKDAAVKWNRVPPVVILHDDDDEGNPIDTAGVKKLRVTVQHPKNEPMDYRVRLVSSDGSKTAWATRDATSSDESGAGDLAIRSDANGPSSTTGSHIVRNHIIGNPSNATVDFVYTPYMDGTTGDNLFGSPDSGFGPVREITLVVQPRNPANSADVGRPKRVTVAADQDKGSLGAPFELAFPGLDPGRRYRIKELRYANGAGEVVRANDVDFVAGASSYSYDATTISGGSLSFTQDDNRKADVTTTFTQPSTPVLLETATYEHSYDNGSTWKHVKARHLLGKATKYSVASAAITMPETIHHKKDVSQYKIRVILTPFGATYETGDTIAAPNKALTSGAASVADDGYAADINPATAIAAPTFIRGTIGSNGLHVHYSKPSDLRPFLQRMEIQFVDNTSGTLTTARDWLDAETGAVGVAATTPNSDPNATGALAAVTYPGSVDGKAHFGDLQRRDLDDSFTSNTPNGALTLGCRARYVDEDGTGAIRYGAWSTFSSITFKSQQDRDTDVPSHNHGGSGYNPLEGFGCHTAASDPGYTGNHGGGNTLGRKFYCALGTVPPTDANFEATALDTFPGKKWNGSAYVNETGNAWDAGNRGIYWNKTLACIEVYGQAGGLHYVTNLGTIVAAINCKAPGVYLVGDVWWFVVAMATFNVASLSSIGLVQVGLFDGASGTVRGGGSFSTPAFTNNWQLYAIKLTVASTFTTSTNVWLRMTFSTFTASTNHRILVKNGIMQKGNTIPRIWVPGAEESKLEPASGVSLSDSRGLAALYNTAGWGSDGLGGAGSGVLVP